MSKIRKRRMNLIGEGSEEKEDHVDETSTFFSSRIPPPPLHHLLSTMKILFFFHTVGELNDFAEMA